MVLLYQFVFLLVISRVNSVESSTPCSMKIHEKHILDVSLIEVKSSCIRISPFTIQFLPRTRKKISFLLIITNIICYIFFNNFVKMLIR